MFLHIFFSETREDDTQIRRLFDNGSYVLPAKFEGEMVTHLPVS